MRILAISTGVGMLALAIAAAAGSSVAVPILLACGVVAVSTNGLAFTAVAEYAGSAWAGRALGIQNTGQNGLAAATPPILALAIGSIGFGASFAIVAAFPVIAARFVPVSAEAARASSAATGSASAGDESAGGASAGRASVGGAVGRTAATVRRLTSRWRAPPPGGPIVGTADYDPGHDRA